MFVEKQSQTSVTLKMHVEYIRFQMSNFCLTIGEESCYCRNNNTMHGKVLVKLP